MDAEELYEDKEARKYHQRPCSISHMTAAIQERDFFLPFHLICNDSFEHVLRKYLYSIEISFPSRV